MPAATVKVRGGKVACAYKPLRAPHVLSTEHFYSTYLFLAALGWLEGS